MEVKPRNVDISATDRLPASDSTDLIVRAPRNRAIYAAIIVGFLTISLGTGLSLGVTSAVEALLGVSNGFALFVVFAASLASFFLNVMLIYDHTEPSWIAVGDVNVRAVGRLFSRTIEFEKIRIIELEPRETNWQRDLLQLVLRTQFGLTMRIWLARHDAERCFNVLFDRCRFASAIDEAKNVRLPAEGSDRVTASADIARTFRDRGLGQLTSGLFCGVICAVIVTGIAWSLANGAAYGIGHWIAGGVATLFAVGFAGGLYEFSRYRRRIVAIRRTGALDFAPGEELNDGG